MALTPYRCPLLACGRTHATPTLRPVCGALSTPSTSTSPSTTLTRSVDCGTAWGGKTPPRDGCQPKQVVAYSNVLAHAAHNSE
jgi:hypothetical protein